MEEKVEQLNKLNLNLENDIKQLSFSNDLNEGYIKNVFPDYIKNKLSDLHIVTVETTDDYTFTSMRQALKMAGAEVTSITLNSERLLYLSDEDKNQLMEYFDIEENIIPTNLKIIAETEAGK